MVLLDWIILERLLRTQQAPRSEAAQDEEENRAQAHENFESD
jgi:hypothetical protein